MAPAVAGMYNQYADRNFMTISYMSEDANGGEPGVAEVQAWANMFQQDGIVAFSTLQDVWYPFGVDQGGGSFSIALPGTMFVGPKMKIAKMGVPTPQEIELVIPD
jgi:hypothetical protein